MGFEKGYILEDENGKRYTKERLLELEHKVLM